MPAQIGPGTEEEAEMRVLHVNGHDMAYAEHGTGTPLLLIHGSLLDQRYWAPQMEALGRHHRVIALSLRHYWPERWDGAGEGFTIQQHVEDVAAFIEALGAGPVHLVGHSRGGHVAFRVAQRFPDRVRALVLAEPGGTLDETLQAAQGASAASAAQRMSLAEATAGAAERIRQGDVEGGVALFVDAVGGPGAWEGKAEHSARMHRDNAYTLIGRSTRDGALTAARTRKPSGRRRCWSAARTRRRLSRRYSTPWSAPSATWRARQSPAPRT